MTDPRSELRQAMLSAVRAMNLAKCEIESAPFVSQERQLESDETVWLLNASIKDMGRLYETLGAKDPRDEEIAFLKAALAEIMTLAEMMEVKR